MPKTPQEIYKFIQNFQPGDWHTRGEIANVTKEEAEAECKGHNKANEAWRTLIKLAFKDVSM